jgi:hypothetical protein
MQVIVLSIDKAFPYDTLRLIEILRGTLKVRKIKELKIN